MKNNNFLSILLLLPLLGMLAFTPAREVDSGPAFAWASINHDFGEIEKDEPVYHKFTFANNGDDVLFITKIKTSCGCTAAEYSTDGIAPGEEGFVNVRYNASKIGAFKKSVSISANTGDIPVLSIMGTVKEIN